VTVVLETSVILVVDDVGRDVSVEKVILVGLDQRPEIVRNLIPVFLDESLGQTNVCSWAPICREQPSDQNR